MPDLTDYPGLETPQETVVSDDALIPLGPRLLILEDGFSYGGRLAIPEKYQRRPTTGVVLLLGPDVPVDNFNEGDHVVYPCFAGTLVESKRTKKAFRIISYDEVIAKIPKGSALELEAH